MTRTLLTNVNGTPQGIGAAATDVPSGEFNVPIPQDSENGRMFVDPNGIKGLYVTDTAAHAASGGTTVSGVWRRLFAHSATVVATATSSTIAGTLTSVAIPAGATWYGKFSTFTLTSGAVTAYES